MNRVKIAVRMYLAVVQASGKAGELAHEQRLHRFLDTLDDTEFRQYAVATSEWDRKRNEMSA